MPSRSENVEIRPFDLNAVADGKAMEVVVAAVDGGLGKYTYPTTLSSEFKDSDVGKKLLEKDPAWNRRCLMALTSYARHYQAEAQRFSAVELYNNNVGNIHFRLCAINRVFTALSRRRLPLMDEDLVAIAEVAVIGGYTFHGVPLAAAVKHIEDAAKLRCLSACVEAALRSLSAYLRDQHSPHSQGLCGRINQLLVEASSDDGPPLPPTCVPPQVSAGRPDVLRELKTHLKLMPKAAEGEAEVTVLEPDQFALRADSPLADQHRQISAHLQAVIYQAHYHEAPLARSKAGKAVLASSPRERGQVLLAASERACAALTTRSGINGDTPGVWQSQSAAIALPYVILHAGVDLDRDGLFDALLFLSATTRSTSASVTRLLDQLLPMIAGEVLSDGERNILHRLRCLAISVPPMGAPPQLARRLCDMLGDTDGLWLVPGEHWADRVHHDLATLDAPVRATWMALLQLASTATASKPSKRWLKEASLIIKTIGETPMRDQLQRWLEVVPRGRAFSMLGAYLSDGRSAADTINEGNAVVLRGFVWLLVQVADMACARSFGELLLSSLKKVPGVGPRAVKVANACVWALGELAGRPDETMRDAALGQLARLKARVTFKTTLKAIEKALDAAAAAAGISRDDLEELGVPAFGFVDGVLEASLGNAACTLTVDGHRIVIRWTNASGRVVKSPPAEARQDYPEQVKDLKRIAKDAEGVLLAGRSRFDNLYLSDKTWRFADWRERFLHHGLLCSIARRLIWQVNDQAVMFVDGQPCCVDHEPIDPSEDDPVCLWHPVGRPLDEIRMWRHYLEESRITQPFKQAHREVYLLTDAERHTNTYSNRFAAHILKQHQFNALCAARGWHNKLRLMVDDSYPPAHKLIPSHGLRAEFWVEGGGDTFGVDTNESGTYLYLATDQVRFYRAQAAPTEAHAGGGGYYHQAMDEGEDDVNAPIPMDQIPALVLSEVLRDVDLFVGVASVGNDPTWADGGPQGRYQTYWHSFSFGDLSATAVTRKAQLERLIPRLKIADQCAFDEKFLIVRGSIRTYRIHMGSGNILMEPNDEYLCIVPGMFGRNNLKESVFLPFEGDTTLSIILSKVLLLAADDQIKDPSIRGQIGRGLRGR